MSGVTASAAARQIEDIPVRAAPRCHTSRWARTPWHRHEGQTLYVTESSGLVHSRGGRSLEIRDGDDIYPPRRRRALAWRTAEHFLTHRSIIEGAPHREAKVTDAEYRNESVSPPRSAPAREATPRAIPRRLRVPQRRASPPRPPRRREDPVPSRRRSSR